MNTGELVGYFGAFAIFLIASILLIVFGIRRLMKRSAMERQRQYGDQATPYAARGQSHPPAYGQPPYGQSPYGSPGGYPMQQPDPYAAQAVSGKATTKKPPNMGLSILMIVIGGVLLLASLSAVAQGASGTA